MDSGSAYRAAEICCAEESAVRERIVAVVASEPTATAGEKLRHPSPRLSRAHGCEAA